MSYPVRVKLVALDHWLRYESASVDDSGWLVCTDPADEGPDEGDHVVDRYPPQQVLRVREEHDEIASVWGSP